jgi:hypothetical protein
MPRPGNHGRRRPISITCHFANASKTSIQFSFGGPLIPCDGHMEEHIAAAARSFARGTHSDMEAFMPRIAIVGLACSTILILLSPSAVPQEPTPGRGN